MRPACGWTGEGCAANVRVAVRWSRPRERYQLAKKPSRFWRLDGEVVGSWRTGKSREEWPAAVMSAHSSVGWSTSAEGAAKRVKMAAMRRENMGDAVLDGVTSMPQYASGEVACGGWF